MVQLKIQLCKHTQRKYRNIGLAGVCFALVLMVTLGLILMLITVHRSFQDAQSDNLVAQPDWLAIHSNGVCQDQALCKFHDYFLSKIGSDTLIVFADCVNTSKVIWQKLFNHKQYANRLLLPLPLGYY